jgi:hypothetical protein
MEENFQSISPPLQLHPLYCTLRSINRNSALIKFGTVYTKDFQMCLQI